MKCLMKTSETSNLVMNIRNLKRKNKCDKNITDSNIDKKFFNNIENMNKHLKEYFPKFYENFELTNFLSSGGTGKVFEGHLKNSKKKQNLAFKFKMSTLGKKDKDSKEVILLKKLHHKNITELYTFIKMNEDSNFIVLELGKYGDLEHFQKTLLKRKVLSETIICYFAKQILEALQYIHRCKVIHLDIKEGNILVDENLNIKLTDFSISCSYEAFHPKDLVKFPFVGTSRYMSPEILNRKNMKIHESCKIDIYSLGVTLFHMAFGIYPYKLDEVNRKDYDNILKKLKEEKLEFPTERKVSELFKDFLKGLLDKDYSKRFSIQKALNHPWIKGAQIIYNEKENSYSHENFLINLITDNFMKFNEYIKIIKP